MEAINTGVKLEFLGVGLLIVIGIAAISYGIAENYDTVKGVVHRVEQGVAIVNKINDTSQAVARGVAEPIVEVADIFTEGLSHATENSLDYESGSTFSSKWMEIFGSDKYNNGFGSLRYRSLAENAEDLAKTLKKGPDAYFNSLTAPPGAPILKQSPLTSIRQISPFWIRQNLDALPFSNQLSGLFGTSATSLKHFVWTDFDDLPEKLQTWNTLSSSDKSKWGKIIKNDRTLLTSMLEADEFNTWIVADRVEEVRKLMIKNNVGV